MAACFEERKPEAQQAKSAAIAPFEWARRQRIVIALSGETVYTPQGKAVELQEMMRQYPMCARLPLFQRLQSIRAMYGFNQLLNFFFVQTLFHLGAEPVVFFQFCILDLVDE